MSKSNGAIEQRSDHRVSFLLVLAAFLGSLLSAVIAIYVSNLVGANSWEDSINEVLVQIFGEVSAALLIFSCVFVIFVRMKITPEEIRKEYQNAIIRESVASLADVVDRFPTALSPEVRGAHYGSFNTLPVWSEWIKRSNKTIDIVVYYFDSWVKEHQAELREFRARGGVVRLFLPPERISGIQSVFPMLSRAQLTDKMSGTVKRFEEIVGREGVEVRRIPRHPSYAAQAFDGRSVFISFYEFSRKTGVLSPVMEFDASRDTPFASFWEAEMEALLALDAEAR